MKKLLRVKYLINYWSFYPKNACFSIFVSSFQAASFIVIQFSFFVDLSAYLPTLSIMILNSVIFMSFDRVELTKGVEGRKLGPVSTQLSQLIEVFRRFSLQILQVFIKSVLI